MAPPDPAPDPPREPPSAAPSAAPPAALAEVPAEVPGGEVLERLRLAGTPGISPRLAARLVREFGSAGAVLRAGPERLAAVRGVGEARAALLAAAPSAAEVLRDVERARAASASVLVPGGPGWPAAFDDLSDPPMVLWCRGDPAGALTVPAAAALGGRGVAIVGSRRASNYGVAQAHALAHALASAGVPIVSGLARGIDAAAHRAALAAGGATIGVLGGGLARFYPPENLPLAREMVAKGGAVLTEFPLDLPPLPHHFPRRNRLIAALAAAVVVVEAAEESGSLLTADHALDLGREVLAVPGRVDQPNSRGVHRLLREGAALCETAADVLAALGIDAGAPSPVADAAGDAPRGADRTERAILEALAAEDLDADAVLEAAGLPPGPGLAALSALEIRGAVALGADGRYCVVRTPSGVAP